MITETSAANFRQNLSEMLNQVQYRHDTVVINKDGKPVAALVDARLLSVSGVYRSASMHYVNASRLALLRSQKLKDWLKSMSP